MRQNENVNMTLPIKPLRIKIGYRVSSFSFQELATL